jgi:hypothetical protein
LHKLKDLAICHQKGINHVFRRILSYYAIALVVLIGVGIAQDKGPFTADRHKERGVKCEACHKEAQPKTAASPKSCLTCHKSLEAVAERTKDFEKNPHDNHITQTTDVECTQCHHGHKEDEPLCNQCHSGMTFEKGQPEKK